MATVINLNIDTVQRNVNSESWGTTDLNVGDNVQAHLNVRMNVLLLKTID